MKKIFFVLSAIALLGLTSCVDPINKAEINPTFDPETNALKTAFTISVATQANTKASASTVQSDGSTFRGMQDMSLLVYQGDPATVDAKPVISLGTLGTSDISSSKSSKVYNLVIPIGVNNMVFYSKATRSGSDEEIGITNFSVSNTAAASTFSLQPIYSYSSNQATFDAARNGILTALNTVIQTTGWRDAYTAYNGDNTTYATYEVLAKLYKNIVTMNGGNGGSTGEIRQGSGFAVLRTIRDLYMSVTNFESTAAEATAGTLTQTPKDLATAIKNSISGVVASTTSNPFSFTTSSWDGFPAISGAKLPEGAAQLTFDETLTPPAFKWVTAPDALRYTTATSLNGFTYPSELCYWVNSPIRVNANENIEVNDYPVTVASWAADASWTAKSWTKNGTVAATTRAVALQNNIQYANALLESTVQYAAGTLLDNQARMLDPNYGTPSADPLITNQSIDITSTNVAGNPKFKITGILVGGQPGQVGWQWIDQATTPTHATIVYDVANINMKTTSSSASDPIYTMVLDNYNGSGTQDDVYIAVEFENNSDIDFWGKNNLIPKGGKFYLIGQLKIGDGTGTDGGPTTAQINAIKNACPDNAAQTGDAFRAPYLEKSNFVFRIFMQDYRTIANFSIGATSLQNAYSTVPDLRSVQMTFGLSVDLQWKAGFTYNNVNLGM